MSLVERKNSVTSLKRESRAPHIQYCSPLVLKIWRLSHTRATSSLDKLSWVFKLQDLTEIESEKFYVYGSVYRRCILLIVQRDATQNNLFIILQVHSTCFGCQTHPSSGVHKTVTTASGTGHIFCAATSLQRGKVGHVGGRQLHSTA